MLRRSLRFLPLLGLLVLVACSAGGTGFSPEAIAARRAALGHAAATGPAAGAQPDAAAVLAPAPTVVRDRDAPAPQPQIQAPGLAPVAAQPTPEPRRRGFFAGLFGRGQEPTGEAGPAVAVERPEPPAAEAGQPQPGDAAEPARRRPGFFARLFGRGDDADEGRRRQEEEERQALAALDRLEPDNSFLGDPTGDADPEGRSGARDWSDRAATSRILSGMAEPDEDPTPRSGISLDSTPDREESGEADTAALLAAEAERRRQAAARGATAPADDETDESAREDEPAAPVARPSNEAPTEDGGARTPQPQLPGRDAFVDDEEIATPENPLGGIRLPRSGE